MPRKEKAKKSQMRPCPFCGCDNICIEPILGPEAKGMADGMAHARAKCLQCGAVQYGMAERTRGKSIEDYERAKASAISNWQNRATPAEHRETSEAESAQWHAEKKIERTKTRIRRAIGYAIEAETEPGDLN